MPCRQQVHVAVTKTHSDVSFLPSSSREDVPAAEYCGFPVRLKPVSMRVSLSSIDKCQKYIVRKCKCQRKFIIKITYTGVKKGSRYITNCLYHTSPVP